MGVNGFTKDSNSNEYKLTKLDSIHSSKNWIKLDNDSGFDSFYEDESSCYVNDTGSYKNVR